MRPEGEPTRRDRGDSSVDRLVVVVMPVHNGQTFIARAIRSVLAQTYSPLELVVIDDGSTDKTSEVVSEFDDPRVRLVRFASNRGAYTARNYAIRLADGAFVAFLDSDDEWFPDKLERQVASLHADGGLDLIHTRVLDVFPSGERIARSLHRRASDYRENLCHDRIATSSVLVRRSVFDEVGLFDETLLAMGDWDMWTRILRVSRVTHLKEPLTIAWLRPGSIQRGDVDTFTRFHRRVLKKRADELREYGLERRAAAAHDYAVAAKLIWAGRRAEARRRLIRSLRARFSCEALGMLTVASLDSRRAHLLRMRLRAMRRVLSL